MHTLEVMHVIDCWVAGAVRPRLVSPEAAAPVQLARLRRGQVRPGLAGSRTQGMHEGQTLLKKGVDCTIVAVIVVLYHCVQAVIGRQRPDERAEQVHLVEMRV